MQEDIINRYGGEKTTANVGFVEEKRKVDLSSGEKSWKHYRLSA